MSLPMPETDETQMPGPAATAEEDQAALGRRLGLLISRLTAANYKDMVDFDHLANDGLSDDKGNLLSQMGTFTLLDRGAS